MSKNLNARLCGYKALSPISHETIEWWSFGILCSLALSCPQLTVCKPSIVSEPSRSLPTLLRNNIFIQQIHMCSNNDLFVDPDLRTNAEHEIQLGRSATHHSSSGQVSGIHAKSVNPSIIKSWTRLMGVLLWFFYSLHTTFIWVVFCDTTRGSSFIKSSRILKYTDLKISDCCVWFANLAIYVLNIF